MKISVTCCQNVKGVGEVLISGFVVFIHEECSFELQTAITKECQENRCDKGTGYKVSLECVYDDTDTQKMN